MTSTHDGHSTTCHFQSSGAGRHEEKDDDDNNNRDNSDTASPRRNQRARKKPSYVGLSCAVSGYGAFNCYTSPDEKRQPRQFEVSSPPHALDSVYLVLSQDAAMRQMSNDAGAAKTPVRGVDVTDRAVFVHSTSSAHAASFLHSSTATMTAMCVESSTASSKFYAHSSREESPCSDSFSSSSGNLIQKQIERLYGGKIHSVRSTKSPDPKSPPSAEGDNSRPVGANGDDNGSSGGFFSKRFGITKQKDRHTLADKESPVSPTNGKSPLEFKPLKVPAVFRLLRPEFREQLKNNSCQIPNECTSPPRSATTSPVASRTPERVIPITRSADSTPKERVIPIERVTTSVDRVVTSVSRVIPVQVESPAAASQISSPELVAATAKTSPVRSPIKPQLPVKPLSPPMAKNKSVSNGTKSPESPKRELPVPLERKKELEQSEASKSLAEEEASHAHLESVDEDEEPLNEEPATDFDEGVAGGVHQHLPLTTILEEDSESTTGSMLNLSQTKNQAKEPQQKDGHHFIKLLENEIFAFEEQICDFEEDLGDSSAIPEDIRDSILAAVGKARLLMAQKMAQFRGLCEKNITQTSGDDPFVPTSGDLAGFWDMIYIQIEEIHAGFEDLRKIRDNQWKRPQTAPAANGTGKTSSSQPKKTTAKPKATPAAKKSSTASDAVAKAKDEARRKMLEEKKRQMLKQKQASEQQQGELFVQF